MQLQSNDKSPHCLSQVPNPPRLSPQRKGILLEGVAVATIFALAATVGGLYASLFGSYARFEQAHYAPAVMVALGYGFVNPDWQSVPGLKEFLIQDTRALSITRADLPDTLKTNPLEQVHLRWRYCLCVVGWIWRCAGIISWDVLTPLYAVLYGLAAVFSYLTFRLLFGWPWALAGTLFIIFSPTNLYFLPHLRDYSKAPAIIAAVCAAGYLVKHGTSRPRTIGTCLALGTFLGLMMGFRKDVFICVWPTVAVLFLFLSGGARRRLLEKTFAAALLLASFYGASWPLWTAMNEKGSASGHVIAYGLLPPFDDFLGIGGVDYELAPSSNDEHTANITGGYAERNFTGFGDDPLRIYTPEYDAACNAFLLKYVTTFPADILLRCYAAALNKMRYGIFVASHESRYGPVRIPIIERLFTLRFKWLHGMARVQIVLFLFCFLVLSGKAARYGLAFAFLVLYYCGYTSLQYDLRHHFHLEFFWWLPSLFFCHSISRILAGSPGTRGIWKKSAGRAHLLGILRKPEIPRVALSTGLLLIALVVPLVLARVYQHYSYAGLFSLYDKSTVRRLDTQAVPSADPRLVDIRIPESSTATQSPGGKPKWFMNQRLLMAEFDGGQDIPFDVYSKNAKNGASSLSHRCLVRRCNSPETGNRLRYFLPIYESKTWARYRYSTLDCFEFWKDQEHRLNGIYEVSNAGAIPLWFMMTMADDWITRPRYKVLQDQMHPLYVRALKAATHNLLPNGGFETWANGAPAGFTGGGPSFSIQREQESVSEGHAAVRQEWMTRQDGGDASNPFGCFLGSLEPTTIYEVIVSARNLSVNNILLSAWDVPMSESGEIDFSRPPTRLRHPLLRVVPCMDYSTYWGTFTTGPSPNPMVYLFAECFGPSFPAVVFWDEWRVHKWPGPRESWDFNLWVSVQPQ